MDLLGELRGGNHRTFKTLYHCYAKPLYWKINGMVKESEEADELVLTKAVKAIKKRMLGRIESIARNFGLDAYSSLRIYK